MVSGALGALSQLVLRGLIGRAFPRNGKGYGFDSRRMAIIFAQSRSISPAREFSLV